MRRRIFSQPLFISLMIAALPVYAQDASTPAPAATPPAAAATSAAQAPASTPQAPPSNSAPAAPSDETLKKARAAGLRAETRKGATVYCYEDANIGTRFTTKKCVDASQLDALIVQRRATRDAALQGPMQGTSSK